MNRLIIAIFLIACIGTLSFAAKVLVVGTDATYPPFEFIDESGKLVGFDVDLLEEIAKRAGFKLKWVSAPFDGLIAGLKSGKFDIVISAMTITEERKKEVDFSIPYFQANQSIAVHVNNNTIKTLKDLEGKAIGTQLGTTGQFFIEKTFGNRVTLKKYNDINSALLDLEMGRLDAVINDYPTTAYIKTKNPHRRFKIAFQIPTNEFYGIAVPKGKRELLKLINKILEEIKKDGTYDTIFKKWFGG